MKKQGASKKLIIFVIVIGLLAVVGGVGTGVYFLLDEEPAAPQTGTVRSARVDPVANMTVEEIAKAFNEDFVEYLLVRIGARELHNPPLSSNTPKIKFYIGEQVFSAEVVDGDIRVLKGETSGEDIVIRTSTEEAAKMVKDYTYIQQSFANGKSGVELKAAKTTLFAKGYLKLYTELTGKEANV